MQDTDGTLFNNVTLPPDLWNAVRNLSRPGITFHSARDSELFDPTECVVVRNHTSTNAGAFCAGNLTWRHMMVRKVEPFELVTKTMWLTAPRHNGTSVVRKTSWTRDGGCVGVRGGGGGALRR